MQAEETLSLSASFHLAKGVGGGVQASSAEQERSRSPLPREVDAHALSAGSSPVSLKRERLPHVEIEKEEAAAKPPPPSRSGFRTCPQHSSEKLTLYAARARCFGCVKCFQEGVLRGHQGQSLQRAHEEVKEKLLRQHGTLLQQSRTVKENMQVNSAAEKLIECTLLSNARSRTSRPTWSSSQQSSHMLRMIGCRPNWLPQRQQERL